MNFGIYLKKHKILRVESEKDLSLGLYNKAVSGFWFSLEALMRYLLIKNGKTPPERPGPLISKFINDIIRTEQNKKKLRNLLNSIYARRREIDHRKKLADKKYALETHEKYLEAIRIINAEIQQE